ncbi:MAG: DUF4190 domain-containing protein [Acidimicrobiales bacterium]
MSDFSPPPGDGTPPPPPGQIPPPPPPAPPNPWGAPPGGAFPAGRYYAEASQASTAMTLGIVSLAGGVLCGVLILLAPVAWIVGQKEISAIDAGRRDPANRGQANAGRIMGIIGTVLVILGILAIVVILAVAVGSSSTPS